MSEIPEHFLHSQPGDRAKYPSKALEEHLESQHTFGGSAEDVGSKDHVLAGDIRPEHVLYAGRDGYASDQHGHKGILNGLRSSDPSTTCFNVVNGKLIANYENGFLAIELAKVYSVEVSQDSILYPEHHTLRVAYHDTTVHVTGQLTKTTAERLSALIREHLLAL